MSRPFVILYGAALALIPWSWFPPFPWLHEHAQWSDAVFALATAVWMRDRHRAGDWPKPRAFHAAMLAYVGWALLSHAAAGFEPRSGSYKLLGMAELVTLAVITEDVVSRANGQRLVANVMAWTCLATFLAAVLAVALWAMGLPTGLTSHAGDLDPGHYARVRAGFPLPNLLASFSIFASGAVAAPGAASSRLRRLAVWGISVAALLSFSRGILGLALAILIRNAETRRQRRWAAAWAAGAAATILGLTIWNVGLNPTRPWAVHLRPEASSRWAAVTSSAASFARAPLLGTGPENLPGMRGGFACDAHLTPLNIAATLGLPALLFFAAIPALLWRQRCRPTDAAIWGTMAGLGLDALGQDVENFRHVFVAFGLAARRSPDD